MRGSSDHDTLEEHAGGRSPLQHLTAVGLDTHRAYGMREFTSNKDDTRPLVARELLADLDIEGRRILASALHTQRETAQRIDDAGTSSGFKVQAN